MTWLERKKAYHKEYAKKWHQEHKQHVLEKQKEWEKTHPENCRRAHRKYYEAHKKEIIEKSTKRNQSERGIAYRLQYAMKNKIDVLTHYGNGKAKCMLCGHDRLTSLSIDHINGGGCRHRRELGPGNTFYRWLIKNGYPEGFRTLCLNCQFDERTRLNHTH